MNATTRGGKAPLALAVIGLLAAACGGGTNEDALERLIEDQTGDSVELDFSDGGINIQSDEGSLTMDDEGNFTAVGADGQVVSGDVDQEDGGLSVKSDEGEVSFQSSTEIPADWPADVPKPDGLMVESGATYDVDGKLTVTVFGSPSSGLADFVAGYAAALQAAGFSQTSFYEASGGVSAFYEDGSWEVSIGGGDSGSGATVTVVVAAAAG